MPHSTHLVFLYGGLRKGFQSNGWLDRVKATHLGDAYYPQGHSKMVQVGGIPGLVPDKDGPAICGDLYRVDWPTLRAIDKAEGCPNFYRRVKSRVMLQTDNGEQEERAWMYVLANPSRFLADEVTDVNCGDWLIHQAVELHSYVDLLNKAQKGETLPKEYEVRQNASCGWSPSAPRDPETGMTMAQYYAEKEAKERALNPDGGYGEVWETFFEQKESAKKAGIDTEKSDWQDRYEELKKARKDKIRSIAEIRRSVTVTADQDPTPHKATSIGRYLSSTDTRDPVVAKTWPAVANRVAGNREVVDSELFRDETKKLINALPKGGTINVMSIAGALVTYHRDPETNLLIVQGWERPKQVEMLNEDPPTGETGQTTLNPDTPPDEEDNDEDLYAWCKYCGENVEFHPGIGWVDDASASVKCLLAPDSTMGCHDGVDRETFDAHWGNQ